jgi:hypothetical protein
VPAKKTAAGSPAARRTVAASTGARLRAFGAFWYDFIVGDDWLVAAGVVAGLAGTYALSQAGVVAWWLVPVVLAVLLPVSLSRAASGSLLPRRTPGSHTPPAAPRTPPAS